MSERVSTLPALTDPCTKLLCAAGVSKTLEGAGTLLPILQACVQAAASTWSTSAADIWNTHIERGARALSDLGESDPASAAHLYKALRPDAGVAFDLQRWRPGATPDETQLDAVLGRALICAGQADNSLPAGLVSGLTTIKLARRRKGIRAKDWELLRDGDLSNIDRVREMIVALGPKSPCASLLTTIKAVLDTGIIPADTLVTPTTPADTASESPTEVETPSSGSNPPGFEDEDLGGESDKSRPPGTASIAARLAAADFATVSEKLGIAHRDHLLPEDLARLTRQVATLLNADDRTARAFATLAMCSVVTGTSDAYTLDLGFTPKPGSIWIDLEAQAWCWDFNAYRNTHRANLPPSESHPIEPIRLPLPKVLFEALRETKAQAPEANRIGDLISLIQGVPKVELTSYRTFLRSLGDSAHPAYQARFARSIQFAFLERTGSDMLTSLCTAFFSTVAPAALYYYQPAYASIYTGVQKVYQFLGFGDHTCPAPASEGLLHSSALDRHMVREGWSQLIDYCNTARAGCLSAATAAERASHATEWMKGLCTAFVIQTAHRASRLERLNFTCLYTDVHVGVINDKDDTTDQHRSTARAIPFTTTAQGILSAAAECLHLMGIEMDGCDGSAPVFRTFNTEDLNSVAAVQTKDIAALTARFFKGARPNFGRALWVTELDAMGCNRWLIRFLTGHTRDVTRVGDGHFDVSVKRTIELLFEQMEALSGSLFGSQTVTHSNVWRPQPSTSLCLPRGAKPQSQKHVDPRNLLDPIEPSTLHGWVQARHIRQLLLAGQVQAEPIVLAVLHMLFIDLLPDPDMALHAAANRTEEEIQDVPCHLIPWTRSHFVHPTLFPLHPTTARLLQLSQDSAISPSALLARLDHALTSMANIGNGSNFASISTPASRWSQLCLWAQAFRRMELAPTLLAVSHPLVPAPTLNSRSLLRLAGRTSLANGQPAWKRRSVQKPFQKKSEDLKELTSLLNHYGDKTKRLGETRQRAKDLAAAIEAMDVNWTYGGLWLRDWLLEELARTRRQDPGCYEITSLRTYVSTLLATNDWVHAADPFEWDAQEWHQFIASISAACREPETDTAQGVHERARPALLAMARSLSRRGQHVPKEVFTALRDDNVSNEPGDSASSVLITKDDQEKAIALSADWLEEDPYTFKLLEVRAQVAAMLPVRSGDVSSLKRDCLTPGGGLVIRRVGFNNHKTQSTIRVTPLASTAQAQLSRTRSELLGYANEGDLLVRGNGDKQTVSRDVMATDTWTQALKAVSNDPRARPHSVRAATLQEIAWPDWQKLAAALLSASLSAREASVWVANHQADWTRLAKASASAGHADIRSALFNYLAGWAVVHAICTLSLLSQETPAPALLRQLDINADNLRKARSRHAASATSADPADHFCPWRWLQSHSALASRGLRKPAPVQSEPICKAVRADLPAVTINDKVLFVSLISLGQSYERTLAETAIPASVARELHGHCLDHATVEQCTNRARHAARDRGMAGDLALCNSPLGQDIRSWLLDLAPSALETFAAALMRSKAEGPIPGIAQWEEISAALPSGFCLKVRQGRSHITEKDFDQSLQPGMRYRLVPDDRLGRNPVLSLVYGDETNRVLSTRATSVTKVTVLCIRAIRINNRS